MPYGIEEINSRIISNIAKNLLDTNTSVKINDNTRRKNLRMIIDSLELLKIREWDNPFFSETNKRIGKTIQLLKDLLNMYQNYKKFLAKLTDINDNILNTINQELMLIIKKIEKWLDYIKPKLEEVAEGNVHLKDLKLHPLKTRFYAKIKEFNPDYTMIMKHPINERQAELQAKRSTEDLLKIDRKDPVAGGRKFRKEDDTAYPGSILVVTNGHHRLYELYKRYLQGKISGDTLVEFIIDEKLNFK